VTTSSAQETFSITLTDEQLAELSNSTITLNGSNCYGTLTYPCYTSSVSSVSYTTSTTGSTFCIPNINISNVDVWGSTEWVNSFPAWGRIEDMCKEYPGLKLAFEKFKNTYNLVKDDFDLPPEKRIKP